MSVFAHGLIMRGKPWPKARRPELARFLVQTINANVRVFLAERPHITVRLEEVERDFPAFWKWIGAEGDLAAAMAEWDVHHNATGG